MDEEKNRSTILLGVGGGVAAFKAVQLTSSLNQAGFAIHVAMSPAAQKFVTPLSFEAVSNRPVLTVVFPSNPDDNPESVYPHLYPATRADIFILAPATADLIGKIAHGLGNEIVSASALSLPSRCQRFFCPAMNVEMWHQPTVQKNVATLESLGWKRIGPDEGHLACGVVGEGRMTEPERIFEIVLHSQTATGRLDKKRILILSGPTIEPIDPVRFISNHSSGKMGKALAQGAVAAGAHVEFITGPVPDENLPCHDDITISHVTTADSMLAAAQKKYAKADVIIFVAAVADYRPSETNDTKTAKPTELFTLTLTKTPDIAAILNSSKRKNQISIGFALETDGEARAKARKKLVAKNLDAIILNGTDSFGANTGEFTWINGSCDETETHWGKLEKVKCAQNVIQLVSKLLEETE